MDPYSQSLGFMDLLYSQQDNQNLDENPYYSYSPSIDLRSPDFPGFSSQCSDEPTLGKERAEEKKERKKWTPDEDIVLISVWLNTSKDPGVGNEQKAKAFGKRIAHYYAESESVLSLPIRGTIQCKQRWQKISDQVCKFVGSYKAAEAQKSSGRSENDIIKVAHQIFHNDHKFKFTLQHAWLELRSDQKWCEAPTTKGNASSKRRKLEEDPATSSRSKTEIHGEDAPMGRPIGVKAAKKQGKKPMEGLVEFHTMWEIIQKDLAMRDKLCNKKLLECLLAKTEQTDEEKALQKKLIIDLF